MISKVFLTPSTNPEHDRLMDDCVIEELTPPYKSAPDWVVKGWLAAAEKRRQQIENLDNTKASVGLQQVPTR